MPLPTQLLTAQAGVRRYSLDFSYQPGANELYLFVQGQLQYVLVSYLEVSTTEFELLFDPLGGEEIQVRIAGRPDLVAIPPPDTLQLTPPLPGIGTPLLES